MTIAVNDHKAILTQALIRLNIITPEIVLDPLPVPMTGVKGKSFVYAISVMNKNGNPSHWIAKFDEPERANKEWAQLDRLAIDTTPQGTLLPFRDNKSSDKVIIMKNLAPNARVVYYKN